MRPQLIDDRLGDARRNGEADADRAAARREDRGVDADHLPAHVERRTARIAAIDRRVDLQEIVVGTGLDIAPARGNNSRCDRPAEAEGISDRHDPVADLSRVAVAPGEIGKLAVAFDFEQGDVGQGVAADKLGGMSAIVLKNDGDRPRLLDDVIVGDDIAGRVDDEAGAKGDALGAARLGSAPGA